MSANFYLVCEETKLAIWIGQGWASSGMECFYSDEKHTMDSLHKFLREHEDKNIMLRHEFYVHQPGYIDYIEKKPFVVEGDG